MQKTKTFWEVGITSLPSACEPALTSWLFRQGCLGTAEKLEFSQPSLKFLPKIEEQKIIQLSAYFPVDLREEMEGLIQKWLKEHTPASRAVWKVLESKDWLEEWKKHFKPFRLSGLLFVPAWVINKRADVIINPGMAFGTGHHATTRFAIRLLKDLRQKKRKFINALDVGSGSGILSVVCERLGAKKVLAIDNDPESWRESMKTFRLNKSRACRVSKKQVSEMRQTFDIVVANIIDGVLMDIKFDLWEKVKPEGHLVLSGILKDGLSAFKNAFLSDLSGAHITNVISDSEWAALIISKK